MGQGDRLNLAIPPDSPQPEVKQRFGNVLDDEGHFEKKPNADLLSRLKLDSSAATEPKAMSDKIGQHLERAAAEKLCSKQSIALSLQEQY